MSDIDVKDAIKTGEWIVIHKTPYGVVYEKKDGSVIMTGTWNSKIGGMVYAVCFKTSKVESNNTTITWHERDSLKEGYQ